MNTTSKVRGIIYLLGILGSGAALWLSAQGYATYDMQTGELDIAPFNVTQLITQAVSWAGNGLALLALVRGWGK